MIFTWPCGVMMMFEGLRSRWDDAFSIRLVEAVRDLLGQAHHVLHGNGTADHPLAQVSPWM